jgi:hypothetical protein
LGEPLPEDIDVLPTVEALHRCSCNDGDDTPPPRLDADETLGAWQGEHGADQASKVSNPPKSAARDARDGPSDTSMQPSSPADEPDADDSQRESLFSGDDPVRPE